MNRPLILATLTTSLLLLPGAGASRLGAQAPGPDKPQAQVQAFEGAIEVREIGVVVSSPEGTPLRSVRPEDLLVFEDGAPRPVVKAEPLRPGAGPSPWRLVVYFDRELAGPRTVHDAALVLSRQAKELTELGPVEIVTANPEPGVELAATQDARSLSAILGGIAAATQKDAGPVRKETPQPAPDAALLQRQLDRLTTFLAGRPDTGARALFLIADGFVPPPGEASFLTTDDPGAPVPPGTLAAELRESARVLAAYGWVTFAGPLRDTSAEKERRSMADMERIRVMAGGSSHTAGTPPVIAMPPADRGARGDERVADVFSRPDSAPWMALSQPTAGTILGAEAQLASLIDGLAGRWRVWYRAPENRDGKLRALEVRLPGAAEPLRGPRWVRSATPEGLAAARARLLATDTPVPGGRLSLDATLEGGTLKLRLPPAAAAPPGPVRITIAFDKGSEVQQVVLPEVSLEKGWEHTLEVHPRAGAQRIAVVVEDLARDAWGGKVAPLAGVR